MTATLESPTTLRPPWLNITRVLWVILAGLSFAAFVASTSIAMREPLPSCIDTEIVCGPWMFTREDVAIGVQLGLPGAFMGVLYLGATIFTRLAFFAVGILIFLRRSDDWMAQLLTLMLVMFALEGVQNLGPVMPLINALYIIPTAIFAVLPFIFPNGRFVPRWIRWVFAPLLPLMVVVSILPGLGVSVSSSTFSFLLLATFLVWFAGAGYSAVYRYRRVSSPTERQQTKWITASLLGFFFLFIPFTVVTIWFPPDTASPQRLAFMMLIYLPAYMVSYLAMPTGVAFSVLRYRLWDIDVLVRKTLVYASLTALLALVFFGVVTLASSLFSAVSGQQSALAIVISTLVIAALFNPLRRRLQNSIDRRFYRKKYDAQQVLAQFALFARDETDLDALTGELARVIQETLEPESVSIWLRKQ